MFFLFSGEGSTDLGGCHPAAEFCRGSLYRFGPMTVVADQIISRKHGYSPLESDCCGFLPKGTLTGRASELKAVRKSIRLPGRKTPKETRYFYNNARVLSRIALELQVELDDDVVVIFFRDSDGTHSSDRGLWEDKYRSMLAGFAAEGFDRGVPMIPKPKSEAWILCALKYNYNDCSVLEERSGNDNSLDSLKVELMDHCGRYLARDELIEMVANQQVDIEKIAMPSFAVFRTRLEEVI